VHYSHRRPSKRRPPPLWCFGHWVSTQKVRIGNQQIAMLYVGGHLCPLSSSHLSRYHLYGSTGMRPHRCLSWNCWLKRLLISVLAPAVIRLRLFLV
jgi:hypothetical protein